MAVKLMEDAVYNSLCWTCQANGDGGRAAKATLKLLARDWA